MYICPPSLRALSRGPPSRLKTLILDLDETLLFRRGLPDTLALYTLPTPSTGTPYPGALPALRALSPHYNIVAVTARWALAARNTRRWLDFHGLRDVFAVHAALPHPGDASRVAFKAAAVQQLRAWGWAPCAGLGDRPSDLAAYAGEGLAALMLTHAHGLPEGGGAARALRLLDAEAALRRGSSSGAPRVLHFTDCVAARDLPGMRAVGGAGVAAAAAQGGALFEPALRGEGIWTQVEEVLRGGAFAGEAF